MSKSKRDHLLDVALNLFLREGFHATGIDRILKEAGVAKMTLYNHFKSKEELVLAVLAHRDETFRKWLIETTEVTTAPGVERLLGLFDSLGDWFAQDGFCGCMFINAAAEYLHQDDLPHKSARSHKLLIRDYVFEQCRAAKAENPDELADQLMLLMEGAIVMAHVCNQPDAAQTGKRAATLLCAGLEGK